MTSVLIIISPELFSEKELVIIMDELDKASCETVIASISTGICTGSRQTSFTATQSLSDVQTGNFDAVVFVGGRGAKVFFTNDDALRIAREMASANKPTAAICLAPVILANAGVLEHKNATVAKTEVKSIEAKGSRYAGSGVIVDGNLITGSSPKYSKRFGQKIIEQLRQFS
jgi:protease I